MLKFLTCDKIDCCGSNPYSYTVASGRPNPPPVGTASLSVSPDDVTHGSALGSGTYQQDTYATMTAVPLDGYEFTGWSGDFLGTSNPAQIYMDSDKSVTANFAVASYNLQIALSPTGAGTATGGGNYDAGDVATLTAIPSSNFDFASWSGDLVSTNNPESLTMDSDKVVTANFTRPQYTVTLVVEPSGAGAVTGEGTYNKGDIASLSAASADPNTQFIGWTGDLVSTNNPASLPVDSDKTVTAVFQSCGCQGLTYEFLRTATPITNILLKKPLPAVWIGYYLRKACRRWVCVCIDANGQVAYSSQIGGATVTGIDLPTYVFTQVAQPTAPGTYIYMFEFFGWRRSDKNPKPRPFVSSDIYWRLYQQTYAGIND